MGIRALLHKLADGIRLPAGTVETNPENMPDGRMRIAELHARRWEEHYRRRENGDFTGKAFLPELAGLDRHFAEALAEMGIQRGRLLEIGAGSGSQSIEYARMGFEVTATDVSAIAVSAASAHASNQGVEVGFVQDNILCTGLTGSFDVISDRGCFTVLPQDCLDLYVENVGRLLHAEGVLLLKLDQRRRERVEALRSFFDVVSCMDAHYQDGSEDGGETLFPAIFLTLKHRAA